MDSYVIVDRSDVIDAIGDFIAAYLATLPEARNMQPKQLQRALKQAFQVGLLPLGRLLTTSPFAASSLQGRSWTSDRRQSASVAPMCSCTICRSCSRAACGRCGGGAGPYTAAQPSHTQPSACTPTLGWSALFWRRSGQRLGC